VFRLVARLLLCGLFLGVLPARAQDAEGSPEPERLKLARLVAVDSGLARSFRGLIEQMQADLRQRAAATRPEAAADLNAALAELQPEFDALTESMTDRAAALYAARLSRRELADVVVFFAGPSGKAYVAAQPALIGDLAAALADWRRQASVTTMTRVRAKMRDKGREF
jgi:hypothetical protein